MGGGSTGTVDHPGYLKNIQSILLFGDVNTATLNFATNKAAAPADGRNIIDRVMGGNGQTTMIGTSANPFFGVAAFSPDPDLQAAVTELNDLEAILDTANMQNQIVELDNTFKERHKFNLAQSYSRVTAIMAGTGAAMGTAFPTALALLEVGFNTDVKDMKLKAEGEMLQRKIQTVALRLDYLKTKLAIKTDQNRQDVTYNTDEAFWDLNVYLRASTAIGAISGVDAIKQSGEPGGLQSILGGMAGGASLGLQAGGPTGAAIGAGVGGLLSLFS